MFLAPENSAIAERFNLYFQVASQRSGDPEEKTVSEEDVTHSTGPSGGTLDLYLAVYALEDRVGLEGKAFGAYLAVGGICTDDVNEVENLFPFAHRLIDWLEAHRPRK